MTFIPFTFILRKSNINFVGVTENGHSWQEIDINVTFICCLGSNSNNHASCVNQYRSAVLDLNLKNNPLNSRRSQSEIRIQHVNDRMEGWIVVWQWLTPLKNFLLHIFDLRAMPKTSIINQLFIFSRDCLQQAYIHQSTCIRTNLKGLNQSSHFSLNTARKEKRSTHEAAAVYEYSSLTPKTLTSSILDDIVLCSWCCMLLSNILDSSFPFSTAAVQCARLFWNDGRGRHTSTVESSCYLHFTIDGLKVSSRVEILEWICTSCES